MSNFNYEITEYIAILSERAGITKELNLVSYNGATPKYDIRSWKRSDEGEKLLKGVTLNNDEMKALIEAMKDRL